MTYLNPNVTIILQKDFFMFLKCYKGVEKMKKKTYIKLMAATVLASTLLLGACGNKKETTQASSSAKTSQSSNSKVASSSKESKTQKSSSSASSEKTKASTDQSSATANTCTRAKTRSRGV